MRLLQLHSLGTRSHSYLGCWAASVAARCSKLSVPMRVAGFAREFRTHPAVHTMSRLFVVAAAIAGAVGDVTLGVNTRAAIGNLCSAVQPAAGILRASQLQAIGAAICNGLPSTTSGACACSILSCAPIGGVVAPIDFGNCTAAASFQITVTTRTNCTCGSAQLIGDSALATVAAAATGTSLYSSLRASWPAIFSGSVTALVSNSSSVARFMPDSLITDGAAANEEYERLRQQLVVAAAVCALLVVACWSCLAMSRGTACNQVLVAKCGRRHESLASAAAGTTVAVNPVYNMGDASASASGGSAGPGSRTSSGAGLEAGSTDSLPVRGSTRGLELSSGAGAASDAHAVVVAPDSSPSQQTSPLLAASFRGKRASSVLSAEPPMSLAQDSGASVFYASSRAMVSSGGGSGEGLAPGYTVLATSSSTDSTGR